MIELGILGVNNQYAKIYQCKPEKKTYTDKQTPGTKIYADNQEAIAFANNSVHHRQFKHIDIQYHYV